MWWRVTKTTVRHQNCSPTSPLTNKRAKCWVKGGEPASKRHFIESELLGLYWIFAGRRFEPKGTECVLKQCCFPHDLAALEEEEGTVTSPMCTMSCL